MAHFAPKQPRSKKRRKPSAKGDEHRAPTQMPDLNNLDNLSADGIMQLQRMIGNQAVGQLLSGMNTNGVIQRDGVQDLIAQHKQHQQEASKTKTSTPVPRQRTKQAEKQERYNQAMAQHRKDRAALLKHVERGAALGRNQKIGRGTMSAEAQKRLANSCEWILAGKTKLYALTPTGDSDKRVRRAGGDPAKEVAYFPAGVDGSGTGAVTEDIAPYDYKDLFDNTNVEIDDDNTVGWNGAGFLAVTRADQRTQEYVWETIRHEVQHDADQNRDKKAAAPTAWQEALEGYKTEYRAYSYEGSAFENLDHDPNNTISKYGYDWTERQLAIFEQIFGEYDHTSDGWGKFSNDNPVTKTYSEGRRTAHPGVARYQTRLQFQQAVVNYVNPDAEGFNKWNSVRVDDFYKALKEIPDGTDVGDPNNFTRPLNEQQQKVQNLIDVLANLNRDDAQYILNDSPDFTALLGTKLQNATHTGIQNLLGAAT
jgi:hypothetical protein